MIDPGQIQVNVDDVVSDNNDRKRRSYLVRRYRFDRDGILLNFVPKKYGEPINLFLDFDPSRIIRIFEPIPKGYELKAGYIHPGPS